MYQKLIIIGNLDDRPELRYTADGTLVAQFSLSTHRRWTDQTGESQEQTTWWHVSVWGRQAEDCNNYMSKGDIVLIEGRLKPDPETGGPKVFNSQDGTANAFYQVAATSVVFLSAVSRRQAEENLKDSPALKQQREQTMGIHLPGARIANVYEVASKPLRGGMGIVYLCFDHQNHRPVALKTFRPEFLPDQAARDLFLREGTIWINLGSHPHIVHAYRVVNTGDGQAYLVLELVAKKEGYNDASLRSWLIPGKPLPTGQALLFALQITRGMGYATAVIPGFVHRDLKPENVLVGRDTLFGTGVNRLRVTDFGLATVLQDAKVKAQITEEETHPSANNLRRTQLTQGIAGTPLYMAPEQWKCETVDVRTDIYAVGCILYEMVTGQCVAPGNSLAALEQAHCTGRLRSLPAKLPGVIRKVVTHCLARDRQNRYPDWSALEAALMAAYTEVTGQTAPSPALPETLNQMERVAVGLSYNTLGASYMELGKVNVALEYFERVCKVGQMEGMPALESIGLNHLGSALCALGNVRQAIELHKQALAIAQQIDERDLEGDVLSSLGIDYAHLGDNRQAVRLYEQALAIAREIDDWEHEGEILRSLGTAYKNLGNTRRAIEFHKQSLTIVQKVGRRRSEAMTLIALGIAYKNIGDAQQSLGFYEQALTIVREVADRRSESTVLVNLGIAYKNLGNARQAIQCYEQALIIAREINDQHSEAASLNNLSKAHSVLGEAQQAIGHYEQALAIARKIGDRHGEGITLGNLGEAYYALEDVHQATSVLNQALAIARDIGNLHGEMDALHTLANIQGEQGDTRQAIKCYEQARVIAHKMGNMDGVAVHSFNMARMFVQQNQLPEALQLAQNAAEIWKQVGSSSLQQAQQLISNIQAREDWVQAENHVNKGIAWAQQGQSNKAIHEFQTALRINSHVLMAHYNLGVTYHEMGRLDDAAREFRAEIDIIPNAMAHFSLGLIYYAQNRPNDAIAEYQAALRIKPDLPKVHFNLGMLYARLGHQEDSIREFQAELRINQNDVEVHNNLGTIYWRQGQLDHAIREYQAAIQIDPKYTDAHINLGKVYLRQGHFDKAISKFQFTLRIKPNDAEAHFNLGAVYMEKSNLKGAIREFKITISINPNDADAHFNLGMAYMQQRRSKKSVREGIREVEIAAQLGSQPAQALLDRLSST